jgi:hypothetical protein
MKKKLHQNLLRKALTNSFEIGTYIVIDRYTSHKNKSTSK